MVDIQAGHPVRTLVINPADIQAGLPVRILAIHPADILTRAVMKKMKKIPARIKSLWNQLDFSAGFSV